MYCISWVACLLDINPWYVYFWSLYFLSWLQMTAPVFLGLVEAGCMRLCARYSQTWDQNWLTCLWLRSSAAFGHTQVCSIQTEGRDGNLELEGKTWAKAFSLFPCSPPARVNWCVQPSLEETCSSTLLHVVFCQWRCGGRCTMVSDCHG